jgi:phosphocarrier protein
VLVLIQEKNVSVTNETGLHARPASQFVQMASKYDAETEIVFDGKSVNAKSIMGVMSLGIGKGSQITIKSEGEDSAEAVAELSEFVELTLPKEDH